MDGGENGHAHAGGLLGGIGLWAAHLAHSDDIRIETKGDVQQRDLVDALPLVLAVAGLGVDDGVDHPAVLLPDELKLTGAVLDGEDPLAVRDGGQEPARHGGLAGAGRACHTDRDAVAQAGGQEIQHFLRGGAAAHKVLLGQILGVDDSDGGRDARVLVQHRGLNDRNTDVLGQTGGDDGTGIVQHLAGVLEHTADDIGRVVRGVEVFLQLDGAAVGILDLNVAPGIDIDLLDAVGEDVLGQKPILGHLRIKGIHQLALAHAVHRHAIVLQIAGDPALHLLLGLVAALCDQGGIGTGEVGLYLSENLRERHPLGLGSEEDIARLGGDLGFRKNSPSGIFLEGDVMHLGLLRLGLRRGGGRGRGKYGIASLVAKHQNTSLQIFSISRRNALLSFMERSFRSVPSRYCSSSSCE